MKRFLKDVFLPEYTWKQRFAVWYLAVSFCLLGCNDYDTNPLWISLLAVANFALSAFIAKKVKLPKGDDDV